MLRPLSEQHFPGVVVRLWADGYVMLLEPIQLPDGTLIEPGFTSDLDSVRRELGLLYAWFKGRTVLAAIIHDYRYRNGHDRKRADIEFEQVMAWEGVRQRYRAPIFWAVRLFGGRNSKRV